MAVLVVRHAKAGDRDRWEGPDRARPLTPAGLAQAEALVDRLADFTVDRILSSPYLRCTQTVAPLAVARGITVEVTDDLAEGAGPMARGMVARLAAAPAGDIVLCTHGDVVLCTHGDVVWEILAGLDVHDGAPMKKGSTWVLDVQGGRVVDARYLPPPSPARS